MTIGSKHSWHARVLTVAAAVVMVLGVVLVGSAHATPAAAASPVHGRLTAVSCPTDSFCMAVGLRYAGTDWESNSVLAGLAYRSTASGWVVMRTVAAAPGYTSIELEDVSCTSAHFCAALGFMRAGVGDGARQVLIAERWNGSAWRFMPIERPGRVTNVGLSCSGRQSCMAVGSRTGTRRTAVTWELVGGAFVLRPAARRPFPRTYLNDVSCVSPSNCTAVGHRAVALIPIAERWNGRRWSRLEMLPSPEVGGGHAANLYSVSCPAPGSCVATGTGPGRVAGDGGDWAFVENQYAGRPWHYAQPHLNLDHDGGGIQPLYSVSCATFVRCAAVGRGGDYGGTDYPVTAWRDAGTHGFVIREPGYANHNLPSYFPADVGCRAAGCVYVGGDHSPSDDPTLGHDPVIYRGRAIPTRQPIPPPPRL